MSTNQSEKLAVEEEPKKGFNKLKDKILGKVKEILEKRKDKPKKEHKDKPKKNRDDKPKKKAETAKETEPATREEQKKKQKEEKKKNKKPRRRIFPIWLRIIVVLILCALALMIGLMVGYGVLGDGKPSDALEMDTWQHIIDIVTKEN